MVEYDPRIQDEWRRKGSIKERGRTIQVAKKGLSHVCRIESALAKSCWVESHVWSCLSFNLKPFDSSERENIAGRSKTRQCNNIR